jgi:hypothetical protein
MSDGLKYNEKAKQWFEGQGFSVTPEEELGLDSDRPKPDFLCSKEGREFWVEVKSIDLPESVQELGDYSKEFVSREHKIKKHGRGFVTINPGITQRDIKWAVNLIDRVLSEVDLSSNENIQHYVVIHKDPVPNYNEFVRIEYPVMGGAGEVAEVLYSVKSQSGTYGRCDFGGDLMWNAKAKIKGVGVDTCHESIVDVLDLGLLDNKFRVSVHLIKGEGQFRFFGIAPHEAEMSRNTLIMRNRASKASGQVNSASDQKGERPALVVFYQESPNSADDEIFVSVFYGDVTCEFSLDEKRESRLFYGHNGFFGEDKNTSISAAVYFRTKEKPILVYNRWAKHPLPQNLLDCKQYVPQDDGSLVVYE